MPIWHFISKEAKLWGEIRYQRSHIVTIQNVLKWESYTLVVLTKLLFKV